MRPPIALTNRKLRFASRPINSEDSQPIRQVAKFVDVLEDEDDLFSSSAPAISEL